MKWTLAFLTLSSLNLWAQPHHAEVRFDPDFEKKCFKEIEKLKCGKADAKNEKVFMKCVDSKITKLSSPCQAMHKSISEHKH